MAGLFALRATRGGEEGGVEDLRSLDYDAQSANFTVGLVVTGGTSGATGTIVTDTDAGATGTLLLSDVKGDFENNEALTDSGTGAATVNGVDTCPLLTPDDELILQVDAVDMTKSEALEQLSQIEKRIQKMDWPSAA